MAKACRQFLNQNLSKLPTDAQRVIRSAPRRRWHSTLFELIVARILQELGADVEIELSNAAVKVKDSHLAAVYRRLVGRRGAKKAIMAVAHRILIAAYHMLLNHEPYQELGTGAVDDRRKHHLVLCMQQRIERLGYVVTIAPMPARAA